jgi:catechol 2,3-dioxygenase-like lactoylglutathione lyase family enzyme
MSEPVVSVDLYTTILRVRNLDRSLEWYRDVLGLAPVSQDMQYRLADLRSPKGQRITLREVLDDKPIVPSGLRGTYVVFLTANADEAHDELARRGYKVGSVQDHPGVRLFWLFDPDEHPLCLLQFVIDWGA